MQLTEHVYLIGSGNMGFNLTDVFDCHIYLIDGGDELAIIDAGAGMGVPDIVRHIQAHGFELSRVRHLILSHAHGDHAGGANRLRMALDQPTIYMHKDCATFLREGDEQAFSLPGAREAGIYPADYQLEACPVDVDIQEDDHIQIGQLQLRVIDTPGHSIGHTSFLMQAAGKRILFGSDLVFFGGEILLQNIWDCDLQAQVTSLQKFRDAQIDVLLPGHLAFSLQHGQRHLDAALKAVDALQAPPNMAYPWV